jgi:hypothetical protein
MDDRSLEDGVLKKILWKLKTANPNMNNAMGR